MAIDGITGCAPTGGFGEPMESEVSAGEFIIFFYIIIRLQDVFTVGRHCSLSRWCIPKHKHCLVAYASLLSSIITVIADYIDVHSITVLFACIQLFPLSETQGCSSLRAVLQGLCFRRLK